MPNQNKAQSESSAMRLRSGSATRLNGNSPSTTSLKSFGTRFDELTALVNTRFDALLGRLDAIEGKVTHLGNELQVLNDRVTSNETAHTALQKRITELESQLAKIQDDAVACDIVLRGVPIIENEDLQHSFSTLCTSLQLPPPKVKNIFRTRSITRGRNSTTDAPIIIKLTSPTDKLNLLKSAAAFRKDNNKILSLRQVGINSEMPIYMNECLSKAQQQILHEAVRLKKSKKLWAVFTFRGRVHVKPTQSASAIEMKNLAMLNDLFRNND